MMCSLDILPCKVVGTAGRVKPSKAVRDRC